MILKLNSKGNEVVKLQQNLTKLGFYCKNDGYFGTATQLQVENFQRNFKLNDDGIVGKNTFLKIEEELKNLSNKNELIESNKKINKINNELFSIEQLKLIIDYEVGGGSSYYNKFLIKPTLPPGASGCTIMIGIDLRFTSKIDFEKMLMPAVTKGIININQYIRLEKMLGIKPSKESVNNLSDIRIPYEYALEIFMKHTVPKFWKITCQTFPGVENLKWQAQVALLSLVFNRGGSLSGSKRIHMRNIRDLIKSKNYTEIAKNIRNMKSLWKEILGLQRRRDAESDLVLS